MMRIANITIVVILMLTVLFSVLACSKADNDNAENNKRPAKTADAGSSGPETEAKPERYTPDLPDIDFGGYEFLAIISTDNIYGPFTFNVEEENGDTINDAVYKRNRLIEEKYNVVLKQREMDLWALESTLKKSVTASSEDFDVCMQIDRYGYSLGYQGYILPAENLPYMDLSRPWYVRDVNESLSVGGKHYIIFSDECLNMYGLNLAICFNKSLVKDLGLESPYELVKSGKWTYDKFAEMCKAAAFDVDGNGVMTDADRYGVLSADNWIPSNFWVCAGIETVVKDGDGVLRLNLAGNTKLLDMLEKAREILFGGEKIYFSNGNDKTSTFSVRETTYGNTDISFQQFESNLGLFFSTLINTIPMMRSFEVDFGIIPFPKANENQERYYTRNGGGFPLMVPAHIENPERTSIIVEAVAAQSKNTTLPAYKEINLRTKYARDEESVEMLDMIFENSFMELGDVMFLDDISRLIVDEIRGKGNFTSLFEKNEAKFQKVLDKVNDAAAGLN